MHWVVATVAVAALVVASVVTCGGAAAAAATATAIVTGTCTTVSTAATVITGAAVGAGVAYAGTAVYAAANSNSLDEFAEYGETALRNTTIGAVVGGAAGYANSQLCCFVAGTPVLTDDGSKAIECIRAGDLVWAWDEKTGDVALKPVVETYINETTELTHIFVNSEEIVCTPTHPFYCPVKGWTDAAQLRAGDILVLVNGEYVIVEKVQHELLESPVKVYNFQVADFHTYYVASGVLVHNSCSQRAAMREAKRSVNIPLNDQPTSLQTVKMIGENGRTVMAQLEIYGDKFIRNDIGGHLFKDGSTLPRHFNAGGHRRDREIYSKWPPFLVLGGDVMLWFGETTTSVSRGILRVSCDCIVDYEQSDNEPLSFGYPAYWDDIIWSSCCNYDYKIYGIYAAKRPREQCNRITDYKQIWGLLNLPKGLAESIVECENNKIYLGMTKETTDGLSECDAPIRLLIPLELVGHLGEIWRLLLSNFCTACNNNWVAAFKSIVCEFPQVIALIYQYSEMVSLTVICDNPKAIQDHFHAVPISKNTPSHFRQLAN